jgi:hypothetical protein
MGSNAGWELVRSSVRFSARTDTSGADKPFAGRELLEAVARVCGRPGTTLECWLPKDSYDERPDWHSCPGVPAGLFL